MREWGWGAVSRKKLLRVQRLGGRQTMLQKELKVVQDGCSLEWGAATGIRNSALHFIRISSSAPF